MIRGWFLGLLALALLVSGLVSLNGGQLVLIVPIILYWAYALWRFPGTVSLAVTRTIEADHVSADQIIPVSVEISNLGSSIEECRVQDILPSGVEVMDGRPHHMLSLGAGAGFAFTYSVRAPRGAYAFEDVTFRSSDTLGLLATETHHGSAGTMHVLPAIRRIQPIPIRPRRTRVYSGVIPARVGGTGVEFFGVRPYAPGDLARRINWRAVARHPGDLYCNEFQQERVADVAVVLDGRERTNLRAAGRSLFEHSVMAAGSIASALLQHGNRVGLLVYSHYLQWTYPGYGKTQRERILRALAIAQPGASQIFEGLQYLPTRLFPPESQIILITPLLEADLGTIIQLRARGYQVLVIAPDPVSYELTQLPSRLARYSRADALVAARLINLERRVLLGRLRRSGVQVVEWDVAAPLDQVMRVSARQLARWRTPA